MASVIELDAYRMTDNDARFFKQLGQRIATLRKEVHMTQAQLAEHLGISQQHMASFEKGIRKVPASLLPDLSVLFAVSLEFLLGVKERPTKRGPAPKLLRQVEQISRLPKPKQRFAMEMLETIIQQQSASH